MIQSASGSVRFWACGRWAVGGLAVLNGRQLLRWIPLVWIARVAALVLTVLGVISAVHAITG